MPALKKYLITGLLVWLPLTVTVWVLQAVLGVVDGVFGAVLSATQAAAVDGARPDRVLRQIPGLGVVVLVLMLLLTGAFAANMFGQWWLRQGNRLLNKIPIVKSIYNSVKRVRIRCSRAAARRFARRCWCSIRARAPGPSPSSPAGRAARWRSTSAAST